MAAFPIYRFTLSFQLSAMLQFLTLIAIPISSLALQTLTNNPSFDPETALLGDAKIVNDSSHVQLVTPLASSSGLLIHRKPFKFVDPDRSKTKSFATDFSFSISPGNGDGLAFVVFPYSSAFKFVGQGPFGISNEKKYVGIEFDTKLDDNVGDVNANHVGIDVNSLVSVSVSNVSAVNLVLNNGEKLKSWIDYDLITKRIEVRLGKFGDSRPYNPILAYPIDLLKMWGNEDVFVGIVSSNGNSEQISCVYSWNFRSRSSPYWMHSLPVDPRGYLNEHGERLREHKSSVCPLKIVARLIFATGCGALLAFMVLFVWAIVVNKDREFPENQSHPADFRYEKIHVVVEEDSKGIKN
ncbi:L-type lectin-domain containing receptor kinase VIII.1-like [Melia azedarach]|uniref:L-type lectin-domain containing receptor kinase VIII.1-like n=1 Tax=Melia azedarach TaxID=155640 RepID=A0ACC1Y9Z6_MELAZ|nr:L-type lectin-domain containing receptor kinase VIII.1-like [Melia azedarach]